MVSVGSLGRVMSSWVEIGARSVFDIGLGLCGGLMVWFPSRAVGYFVGLGFWLFGLMVGLLRGLRRWNLWGCRRGVGWR